MFGFLRIGGYFPFLANHLLTSVTSGSPCARPGAAAGGTPWIKRIASAPRMNLADSISPCSAGEDSSLRQDLQDLGPLLRVWYVNSLGAPWRPASCLFSLGNIRTADPSILPSEVPDHQWP